MQQTPTSLSVQKFVKYRLFERARTKHLQGRNPTLPCSNPTLLHIFGHKFRVAVKAENAVKIKKQPYAKKHKVMNYAAARRMGRFASGLAQTPSLRRFYLSFLLGCFILWRVLERAVQPRARLFKLPPQCQI